MMPHESSLWAALGKDHYRGRPVAWIVVLALGLLTLLRGSIHLFADDGGAGRIAAIDLTHSPEVIVFLFAVMGVEQLVTAAIDFAVALRFRALVPAWLGVHLLRQIGAVTILWFYKGLPVPAPGKYGAVVVLPIIAMALWAALRPGERQTPCGKETER